MSNITFDKEAKVNLSKEKYEWIRIWCEDTNNEELPRIALIGDSITEGYYNYVKEALRDIAKVDYLATSYSVASNIYIETVKNFINDSDYKVVHFNYGLHAYSVPEGLYASCCKELLQFICERAKTIVATTTTVLDETLEIENSRWKGKVFERNEIITQIATELNLAVNDLNSVCKEFDKTKRNTDGVHFVEAGYKELAKSVVLNIKELL